MTGEPIMIRCEGSACRVNNNSTCAMCGQFVVVDQQGNAVEHQRDDILARIERGDYD